MKNLLLQKENKAWNELQIAEEKRDKGYLTQIEFYEKFYTWKTYNDLVTELGLRVITDENTTLIYDADNHQLKLLKDMVF